MTQLGTPVILTIDISWWVRPLMWLAIRWHRLTRSEIDYNSLTNFAVKYGMKVKIL